MQILLTKEASTGSDPEERATIISQRGDNQSTKRTQVQLQPGSNQDRDGPPRPSYSWRTGGLNITPPTFQTRILVLEA